MQLPQISGIQQIGIGNQSVYDTWEWYRKHLGLNVPVFDEAAEANLMLPYTGGKPRQRHAILALNMMGGGGAEIWQYTSRVAEAPTFMPELGDLGIYIAKYKSKDVDNSFKKLKGTNLLTDVLIDPDGNKHFYGQDPDQNVYEIVESNDWFNKNRFHCGGVCGAVVGVTQMDQSIKFYQKILGYDQVVYDQTKVFDDFSALQNGSNTFRRVLLKHSKPRVGPFSKLLGSSEMELVQQINKKGRQIFKDRMWGDMGYIHLCFDIIGMDEMREKCKTFGSSFQVDSGDFDMGEAAGQFAYIEDPDGMLIEFVETHKLPILKKLSWYLDIRKRDRSKSLPRWMLQAMGLNAKKISVNK